MDINVKLAPSTVAVVSDDAGLTFATRKEWRELPETALDQLNSYQIRKAFKGASAVFFLVQKFQPLDHMRGIYREYLLTKIIIDEEGKQVFRVMELSTAEAEQMLFNKLTLWD